MDEYQRKVFFTSWLWRYCERWRIEDHSLSITCYRANVKMPNAVHRLAVQENSDFKLGYFVD